MARKKKPGKGKKAARQNLVTAESEYGKAPHTFVFQRGTVGKSVQQLLLDTRRTLEPYTASSLRARKKNVLKDFVSIASPLGISHFMVFTKSEKSTNMRIMRIPRGPTITFKVKQYSLIKDVQSNLKRPNMYATQFRHHPLLILNNFSKEQPQLKLAATVLQNMFPSINVHKVHLNNIRRCVLFNYDPQTQLIELRHYSIKLVPLGVSRSAKKLLKNKVPDLSKYTDVSDFFLNAGQLSESEAEQDGSHNEVTVPQVMNTRGTMNAQKSAIRLIEIGPRIQLEMIKVEEGLCEGEVMYHRFVQKTAEEVAAARKQRLKKKKEKDKRKSEQKSNVETKAKKKEDHKTKSLEGIKKKQHDEEGAVVEEDEIDDSEYFRQEVGEEPDAALFPKRKVQPAEIKKRKAPQDKDKNPVKRFKTGFKASGGSKEGDARRENRSSLRGRKSMTRTAGRGGRKPGTMGREGGKMGRKPGTSKGREGGKSENASRGMGRKMRGRGRSVRGGVGSRSGRSHGGGRGLMKSGMGKTRKLKFKGHD